MRRARRPSKFSDRGRIRGVAERGQQVTRTRHDPELRPLGGFGRANPYQSRGAQRTTSSRQAPTGERAQRNEVNQKARAIPAGAARASRHHGAGGVRDRGRTSAVHASRIPASRVVARRADPARPRRATARSLKSNRLDTASTAPANHPRGGVEDDASRAHAQRRDRRGDTEHREDAVSERLQSADLPSMGARDGHEQAQWRQRPAQQDEVLTEVERCRGGLISQCTPQASSDSEAEAFGSGVLPATNTVLSRWKAIQANQ